jgi:phosphatidylserine/phosphatidylglycerophosphate/cardiolipin synthase-like enzyme
MIENPHTLMSTSAVRLAGIMPSGTLQAVAQIIGGSKPHGWADLKLQITQVVPQPQLRALVLELLSAWQQHAAAVTPAEVALMLRTAAISAKAYRESQAVELMWTGPVVTGATMRRTDQALLEVITSAQQSLLIVSFAVYKIPAIAGAIVQAASRGVTIRICVEAPEPSGQTMAYDTIKALGPAVAQRAALYVWPSDQRPHDAHGHAGVLHAKCAVADSQLLFLSSANLTDYAMNLNIELGVLIRSAPHAQRVATQFEQLIAQGILRRVASSL